MDAPSTLYYQCTLHSGMNGVIYVLDEGSDSVDLSAESIDALADVDTTTAAPAAGQALVWDGANWIPGNVLASGVSGSAISQRATEAQISTPAAWPPTWAGNLRHHGLDHCHRRLLGDPVRHGSSSHG